MTEEIVLVDGTGKPVGRAPKLESHHAHTPLHLGFSCYIFNSGGGFLLTRRAKVKKVWPGVWTNSVCGHPAPGEEIEDAILRRLDYELGIKDITGLKLILPDYRYKTPPYKGIVENEICPVYVAVSDKDPTPNPDEVEAYEWVDWDNLENLISAQPSKYSYWMKDQLPLLAEAELFKGFIK